MLSRRCESVGEEEGFTLVELIVATTVLVIVMAAIGPVFYGAMRLTGLTGQRSQATNIAVAAIEQLRSLPYSEVGFHVTPAACNGSSPVTLGSAGPMDGLSSSTVVGHTTYTIVRCVYWSQSSMPSTPDAYKQTYIKVSWPAAGGVTSVTQSSALYPGGYGTGATTTTSTTVPVVLAPSCAATPDPGDPTGKIKLVLTPAIGTSPGSYWVYWTTYDPTGPITSSSNPYSTIQVKTTTVYMTVGAGTTYYFQVAEVSGGTVSALSSTCPATTASPIMSSAAALNLALGGSTTPYTVSSPPTSATNNGTGSNAANTAQPTVTVPGADSFLSVNAATQTAEANTNGSAYACAGVLSNGQTLGSGSPTGPCTTSGTGSGGISLNLSALPGVGSVLSGVVAGIVLKFNGASSWAAAAGGGVAPTGSAALTGGSVVVTPLGGLLPVQTIPLSLPSTLTSPTDILQAIKAAIGGNPVVGGLAGTIQSALASVITMTGGYQTTANGGLTESALHIGLVGGAGTADLAISSVGPAATTTSGSCALNSLVVTPPGGPAGGDAALTGSGALANGNSFQLAINASPGCSNVQVGYAPSGCVPGSQGCATSYATMTGTGGTYYGTAGTSSTVWQAGTSTFIAFIGSTQYSPATEQQVTMCTETGSTGQC